MHHYRVRRELERERAIGERETDEVSELHLNNNNNNINNNYYNNNRYRREKKGGKRREKKKGIKEEKREGRRCLPKPVNCATMNVSTAPFLRVTFRYTEAIRVSLMPCKRLSSAYISSSCGKRAHKQITPEKKKKLRICFLLFFGSCIFYANPTDTVFTAVAAK